MFEGARHVLSPNSKLKGDEREAEPQIFPVQTATELLATERRQQLLKILQAQVQLPSKDYQSLYLRIVQAFAEFVQHLPETQDGYYLYNGGLLDHGLERATRALALSRNFLSAPDGATKEILYREARLRFVIFTVALLFDVGKVATKINVSLCNHEGLAQKAWLPYSGSMVGQGTHYKYIYEKDNWDYLRTHVTPLLARQLIDKGYFEEHGQHYPGFSWIALDKEMLETWFAMFVEETRYRYWMLSIVPLADAQTIAGYFDLHHPGEVNLNPQELQDFWEKYGPAIDNLVDEANATTLPSHEKETQQQALKETLKKETPLMERPWENMGFDVLQRKLTYVPAQGLTFLRWLVRKIHDKSLIIGQANADVRITPKGVLITENAFKRFVEDKSNLRYKNMPEVIKQFSSLGLTAGSGQKLVTFSGGPQSYAGARKLVSGVLVTNGHVLFGKNLPAVEKNLTLVSPNITKSAYVPRFDVSNPLGKKASTADPTPNATKKK